MSSSKGIVWFRNDLRVHDNEALTEAVSACDEILPVYIFDDRIFRSTTSFGFPKTGLNRTRFIIESIRSLRNNLVKKLGSKLIVRCGKTEDILFDLAFQNKTRWIFCNRERTREEVAIQDAVEVKLWSIGQEMRYSRGKMLLYTSDLPFPVTHTPELFSTFKKEVFFVPIRIPLPIPNQINSETFEVLPGEIPDLRDFGWEDQIGTTLNGGEQEGLQHVSEYLNQINQSTDIDLSYLSPWISQGCLSVKTIYHLLKSEQNHRNNELIETIVLKLLRRDHFRLMAKKYGDLIFQRKGIQRIETSKSRDVDLIEKWSKGKIGEPLIDAAINALVETGYISHRLRLVVSSFFIHELKQDWRVGAEFFESHLIDYDPCSNYGNWNLMAGVGAVVNDDSSLNIKHQRRMLDPDGTFIEKWTGWPDNS